MKKMFRKILAAAITATMALSSLPVFAADADYINIENDNGIWGLGINAINTNASVKRSYQLDEMANGFGSKPAGDTFGILTISKDKEKIHVFNNTDITWNDVNKTRILNVEMDFVPVAGIKEVRLWQTNNYLSQILDLSGANKNDWNHLKYEIDLSAGRMAVELNGEKVRNIRLAAPFDWTKMSQMRIQFEGDGKGNTDGNLVLYSDNVKIYTTDTADQVFLNDNFTYNTANNQYYTINAYDKLSYVTGTGGKAVDDRALDIVTNNKNDTYLGIYIPVTSEYVKVQYNIMPKTNFNTLTNQARNTALHYDMIKVSDGKTLVSNQWNKVELLLENKTGYNSSTMEIVFGTKLYINGSLVSDVERGKGFNSKESAESDTFPLRIRIGGADAAAATEFVLDDLKIMTSTTPFTKDDSVSLTGKDAAITEPVVYPKTPLSNGTVSAYDTTKVSDFSANGAAVRAFTDNTYNDELTETDVIELGNVIVTEDSNHQIKYYDVTELVPNPGFEPIDVSINYDDRGYGVIGTATKGTSSLVSGKAGKADTDYSMKIDKNTASGAMDVYLEYQAVPSEAEFITVEYNILPDQYFSECYLGARYSNPVGALIKSDNLNVGQWNNIKYIFKNLETSKTAAGENCAMTADIYVNGKWIASSSSASATLSEAGKYQLRFISTAKEAASPMTVYYDDIRIKTYESMPSADIDIPELVIEQNYGLIDNDAMTVLAYVGTKIDMIDAVAGAFDIVAYTDDTFSEQVTDELSAGNIIVVSNADKDMFYYTVIPGSMTIDLMEFAYSSDGTSYTDASKTDIKNGYYKYTVTATNTTSEDKKVTAIIALYNSADKLEDVKFNTLNIPSGSVAMKVPALLQVTNAAAGMKIKTFVWDTMENAKPYETDPVRILVIGNSITQHNASSTIGWLGTWGMAASSEDKDYVHRLISKINTKTTDYELKYRNISEFEKYFYNFDKFTTDNYKDLADFDADIIIATFGANCNNSENEMDPEYNAPYQFAAADYEKIINFFNVDGNAKIIAGKTVATTDTVLQTIEEAAALHPEWKLVDMTAYTGADYDATSYYQDYPEVFADKVSPAVLGHPGDKAMEAIAADLWSVLPVIMDSVR